MKDIFHNIVLLRLIDCGRSYPSRLFLLLFISSCSTTHIIATNENIPVFKHAIVVTSDETQIEVIHLNANDSIVTARDFYSNEEIEFVRADIKRILHFNNGKGAFIGTSAGAMIGLLIGTLFVQNSDTLPAWPFTFSIGAGIGAGLGSIIAYRDTYLLQHLKLPFDTISNPVPRTKEFQTNIRRREFFAGGELNFGSGGFPVKYTDTLSSDNSGSGYSAEGGILVTPSLQVGIRIGEYGFNNPMLDTHVYYDITRVMTVATFYPFTRGLFIRGGLGAHHFTYRVEGKFERKQQVLKEDKEYGGSALISLGYAHWMYRGMNLTIGIDQIYETKFKNAWTGVSVGLLVY